MSKPRTDADKGPDRSGAETLPSPQPAAPKKLSRSREHANQEANGENATLSELKRGGAGAATVCFLVGGHSATSSLLEHHLVEAILQAAAGAACGIILLLTVLIVARFRDGKGTTPPPNAGK